MAYIQLLINNFLVNCYTNLGISLVCVRVFSFWFFKESMNLSEFSVTSSYRFIIQLFHSSL